MSSNNAYRDDVATARESKDGMKWFFGALVVSFLFLLFLIKTDTALSTSQREQNLGRTLKQLRGAQAGLGTDHVDPRIVLSGGEAVKVE